MRELDPGASVLAYFGSELRRHRQAAGMSQQGLARECYVSAALIGMFETARRVPNRDFMARADEALGTDMFTHMWRLITRESHPSYFRPFTEYEPEAVLLREFQPLAVSGLLQTEDYARTILRSISPDSTADEVEELVNARMERQAILDRPGAPTLVVLLDEGVLARVVGGPVIMRDQLGALLAAAERPKVAIQVVPASAGAAAGLAGMFVIATMNDNAGDIAYAETVATGQLIDRADDVATFATAYEMLRAEALPREPSLDLIRKRKEEYEL